MKYFERVVIQEVVGGEMMRTTRRRTKSGIAMPRSTPVLKSSLLLY
jgi:hypothetical protein